MSFLKKVGQLIVQGVKILAPIVLGIGPLISATSPEAAPIVAKIDSDLTQFQQIIVTVEALGASLGLSGSDKLKAAAPLFSQAVQQWASLLGHTIENGPLMTQGATKIADGMADVMNSMSAQTIQAAPALPVPPPPHP